MAQGDPLKAKDIYDNIDSEWWHYWNEWNSAKAKADEKKRPK